MSDGKKKTAGENKRELLRYTVLAVLFWLGLYLANYLTVYLQSLGFSGAAVGYVSSAAAATGMIGNYLAGRISDRLKTVKWVTVAAVCITGAGYLLFPAAAPCFLLQIPLALLWWPLVCLFRAPACTMVENWIVRGATREGFRYGIARAGGSAGSCISSVAATLLVTALYAVTTQTRAVEATYLAGGALMLVCAGYALTVRDAGDAGMAADAGAGKRAGAAADAGAGKRADAGAGKRQGLAELFSGRRFAALLLFFFALNVFINPPFVFLPYILTEAGIDTAMLGMIIGWEALLEIPLLFLLARLRNRFSLPALVAASGVLFGITALGQGMSGSLIALLCCGICFGAANSLNFSCGFNYVYQLAPQELKATAHTLCTIAGSLGIIVGNLFAGVLLERLGTRPFYYLFGVCTFAVSGIYALSFLGDRGREGR